MMAPERKALISFQDIVVDLGRAEATHNGQRIDLEPKALRVLAHLIENRQRVVSKEELISEIWAGSFVTDNAITRVIAQIRKQLGDSAKSPRYIKTVATVGYRFIGGSCGETPALALAETSPARLTEATGWRVMGVIACLLVTGIAIWWLIQPGPRKTVSVPGLRQITSSAAADLWPSFSPDGSQIVFSSDRGGGFELYTQSLAAGSIDRQITSDGGENVEPVWSPSGREIAYVSRKRGQMAVVPASGGVARYFAEGSANPAWSPDGRAIVYSSGAVGKMNLWLIGLDGRPARPLTRSGTPPGDHQNARWLADGRHIVFSAFFPTKGKPWIVDAATGRLQPIEIAADSVMFASFSARDGFLYFTTPDMTGDTRPLDPVGLWRARIDSRWRAAKPELLIPSAGAVAHDMALASDGSQIAISQMRREVALWTLPLNGSGVGAGEPKPVMRDNSISVVDPVFSPDGAKLAFASLRQGGNWTVFVARPDGSSPHPVTAADESASIVSWSGNESVAYLSDQRGRKHFWIAPLNGPPKRFDLTLDLGPYAIVMPSPDGKRVVAHSGNRTIGIKLVIIDLATGDSRDLTPPGRTFVFPAWSPDGNWISAVERIDPNTNRRVVIDVSAGTVHNLVDAPSEPMYYRSNWAPDNDRIAFASRKDGISDLYWVSRSTGKLQQLTDFHSQSQSTYSPAWSPKGDQIVFMHGDTVANIYVGQLNF